MVVPAARLLQRITFRILGLEMFAAFRWLELTTAANSVSSDPAVRVKGLVTQPEARSPAVQLGYPNTGSHRFE